MIPIYILAASGAVSDVVSATLGTPADVVKSRMMSQQYDINDRGLIFSSSLDCLMSTVSSNPLCMALLHSYIPPYQSTSTSLPPLPLPSSQVRQEGFWAIYKGLVLT